MFTDISASDMLSISGGTNWLQVGGGVLVVVGSIWGGVASGGTAAPAAVIGVLAGAGMVIDGFN